MTDDPHYFVVDGRRWRTTDPGIPDRLRAELVAELMSARRAVRDHATDARARVQDAKVALGERGEPWWEDPSPDGRDERLTASMLALLRHRDPLSTICPSDVSRVVAGEGFRTVMDDARRVAAALRDTGVVRTTQKGDDVDPSNAHGPIRIGRGPNWPP
ncbi:DUF3253 domain-containing protein [Lapillicoccus sp.]|uniref:DUF3253 domain-containing protein n=1 Tax=Lapillicoccus sp. TaxID=1909287 RepID=UPI00326769DC